MQTFSTESTYNYRL